MCNLNVYIQLKFLFDGLEISEVVDVVCSADAAGCISLCLCGC